MHPVLVEFDFFGLATLDWWGRAAIVGGIGLMALGWFVYQDYRRGAWDWRFLAITAAVVGAAAFGTKWMPVEPWPLHTYGVLIAAGFLVAMYLTARQAKREGEDPDRIVDLAFYVLLSGLAGARVVFIITKLPEYMADPQQILMFWRGGLVWYGGFIGAAAYIAYYCKKERLPFFKFVDLMIPYMALAHAFGRLGCVAAGCCYGKPTEMAWGIHFPLGSMAHQGQQSAGLIGYSDPTMPVHPTQLYEAGAELCMFWLLLMLRPHKRFHGQLFLVWLSAYPVIRSLIELFRGDKERGVFILSTSQYISIVVAAAAAAVYFYLRRQRRDSTGALQEAA
jgi:phosphatidylglycerol---prolipoprotein diacylglyceryl transferase